MVLTKRQNDILIYLCSQRQYVTIKQLAVKFSVSPRTIQNDLAFIDSFLSDSKIIIDRKTSRGIKLSADESEIYNLRKELNSLSFRTLDNYERSSIISLLLLCNPLNTFEHLANACCVSRQTIVSAFLQVEEVFRREGIEIHKIQGKGIKVSGDEYRIRKYFENKLSSLISDEVIMNVVIGNSKLMEFDKTANEIMELVENKLNVRFAETEKIKLLLDYSLLRINDGNILIDCEDSTKYESLVNDLSSYSYSIGDKAYLCSLLMNAKITEQNSNNLNVYQDDMYEASIISKYLLDELQAIQPLDTSNMEYFMHGLTLHLKVAIYRIRNKIAIQNKLLPQIKVCIPLIYEFTKKQLLKCEKRFQLEFDENEIAFIAMYIASAYEDSIMTKSKLTVLLVCSFGIATSSILKTRILQAIPGCNIVGPLPERDAKDYLCKNEVNLIISTNNCQVNEIPAITVNPLLYPEDVDFIKNRLFQLSYEMMCNHFIKSYANYEKEEIKQICMKDYVAEEDIQIVDSCRTWEDAIRLAAKPLIEKSKLEQRYVNKMIEAVEQFGTYMVLVPETAFIHAGTEDGINENCTALLVLKNPLVFGNKNSKMVRNLVVLGVKNKGEDSLLKLIYIFENESNLESLKSKKITTDIILNMHGLEG